MKKTVTILICVSFCFAQQLPRGQILSNSNQDYWPSQPFYSLTDPKPDKRPLKVNFEEFALRKKLSFLKTVNLDNSLEEFKSFIVASMRKRVLTKDEEEIADYYGESLVIPNVAVYSSQDYYAEKLFTQQTLNDLWFQQRRLKRLEELTCSK